MNPAAISASVLLLIAIGWSYGLLRRLRDWRAALLIASLTTSVVLLALALASLLTTGTAGLLVGPRGLQQLAAGSLVLAAVIQFNVSLRRDALTGLPNRALLMRRVGRALRRVDRGNVIGCAVLLLDVDRFKVVNDSLGHGVGDRLLGVVARRLLACVRKGDTVARLGGDEFVALLQGVDRSSAARAAERIQEALSRPITLKGQEVFTTASIGIAVTTSGGEAPETMLREADVAMHRAKMLGRSRHAVFEVSMGESAVARLQLETDLRRATERRELFLHYQPIVALGEGRVVGLEALLRWQHSERGTLSPATFIPLAEETGLIVPIGLWVLEEACRQMCLWQDQFPGLQRALIHVNLSGQQFMQPDLVDQVARILERTGLSAECLGLEMTETVMMSDAQQTTSILAQLRTLKVKLQLDDFGTGYSSLSYLHRFPITSLKIDRSFVMAMHAKEEHAKIVRSINTLARDLQLEVIAEGIEKVEQLELLRAWGCKFGQGNYLCAATDRETVEGLLAGDWIPGESLAGAAITAN
jgi:diguanylate cyclase (GGDEF)-like protein